jgi:hypothetical protein
MNLLFIMYVDLSTYQLDKSAAEARGECCRGADFVDEKSAAVPESRNNKNDNNNKQLPLPSILSCPLLSSLL